MIDEALERAKEEAETGLICRYCNGSGECYNRVCAVCNGTGEVRGDWNE